MKEFSVFAVVLQRFSFEKGNPTGYQGKKGIIWLLDEKGNDTAFIGIPFHYDKTNEIISELLMSMNMPINIIENYLAKHNGFYDGFYVYSQNYSPETCCIENIGEVCNEVFNEIQKTPNSSNKAVNPKLEPFRVWKYDDYKKEVNKHFIKVLLANY